MRWLRCLFLSGLLVLLAFPLCYDAAAAIDNASCMECHSDQSLVREKSAGMSEQLFVDYSKFKYSVHNINNVACVDCHAGIDHLDEDADVPHDLDLADVACVACHEEQGLAYENSVHSKAGSKGITIPCHACHGYHYVYRLEGNTVLERENHFCLKCHDPNKFHDWLPQKETHFAHVECTVCHAPEAPRHIHLSFFDLVSGKFLDTKTKLEALNTDLDNFLPMLDKNGDGILNVNEFEDMVLLFRQKNIHGSFRGELLSDLQPIVHHVNRGEANRGCEACHLPNSPFFQDVSIVLDREDGTLLRIPVERAVLESYYLSHFYALGGTRVRVLDKIGIALVAGGILVVFSHLTARVATIGRRRRKKAGSVERDLF